MELRQDCGLAALSMILNALQIDPKRLWKVPWRWFSEDLLDCCAPLEEVKKKGITFDEFSCNTIETNLTYVKLLKKTHLFRFS